MEIYKSNWLKVEELIIDFKENVVIRKYWDDKDSDYGTKYHNFTAFDAIDTEIMEIYYGLGQAAIKVKSEIYDIEYVFPYHNILSIKMRLKV